jgi:hypothetical protein
MGDTNNFSGTNAPASEQEAGVPTVNHTERLVRETWRHYYVARLTEAQFGPDSLEASIAQSRMRDCYRDLRASLRQLDPYYVSRGKLPPAPAQGQSSRPLRLVCDEPGGSFEASEL